MGIRDSAHSEQPRVAPRAAALAWGTGPAGATIADQDPAVAATLSRPRGSVGAVADQRAAQQRLRGRIDRIEPVLSGVGGFGAGVGPCARGQRTNELIVKRSSARADGLITLGVRAEKRREGSRHFVLGGGEQYGRRSRRCCVGSSERFPDPFQIHGRRGQDIGHGNHEGHRLSPRNAGSADGVNAMAARRPIPR